VPPCTDTRPFRPKTARRLALAGGRHSPMSGASAPVPPDQLTILPAGKMMGQPPRSRERAWNPPARAGHSVRIRPAPATVAGAAPRATAGNSRARPNRPKRTNLEFLVFRHRSDTTSPARTAPRYHPSGTPTRPSRRSTDSSPCRGSQHGAAPRLLPPHPSYRHRRRHHGHGDRRRSPDRSGRAHLVDPSPSRVPSPPFHHQRVPSVRRDARRAGDSRRALRRGRRATAGTGRGGSNERRAHRARGGPGGPARRRPARRALGSQGKYPRQGHL